MKSRLVPLLIALPVVVGYGAAEGWWTDRWRPSEELENSAARLRELAVEVGPCQGQPLDLTEREQAIGQIKAYWRRRFVHPPSGKVFEVLLVCGRPGPLAAHTPEVCFAGSGYRMVAEPVRQAVGTANGSAAEFWTALFRREEGPLPDPLRVWWAWNATGAWEAPANARFHFARHAALYKLYVVQYLSQVNDPGAPAAAQQFVGCLLPALQRQLFRAP
jgi:hypothetical protein